jgi:hypothetical protein
MECARRRQRNRAASRSHQAGDAVERRDARRATRLEEAITHVALSMPVFRGCCDGKGAEFSGEPRRIDRDAELRRFVRHVHDQQRAPVDLSARTSGSASTRRRIDHRGGGIERDADQEALHQRLVLRRPSSEYTPGRSASLTSSPPNSTRAVVMSTVMPGQFATRRKPSRLKKIGLPVFGADHCCGGVASGAVHARPVTAGSQPSAMDVIEQHRARVGADRQPVGDREGAAARRTGAAGSATRLPGMSERRALTGHPSAFRGSTRNDRERDSRGEFMFGAVANDSIIHHSQTAAARGGS